MFLERGQYPWHRPVALTIGTAIRVQPRVHLIEVVTETFSRMPILIRTGNPEQLAVRLS